MHNSFARKCFRLALALCAAAILNGRGLSVQGLNGQGQPDKGKQVFEDAIAALGGPSFLHMQTRVESGRIYAFFHNQLSGLDITTTYVEYQPTKPAEGLAFRKREVLGKKQDYSYLFFTDQGWDVTYRGARPLPDETWDRYLRDNENDILYILRVRRDEPGLLFDYVGSQVYLSTHVEILDITDSKSRTVRVYFDHNTHLPIRETFTWMDPDTKYRNDEEIFYDKYRDVGGGIMWPFTIERQKNGYKTYQMFATKVEANQTMPAKIFDLPPGAKVLKKVN